jgi:hypothetical protein
VDAVDAVDALHRNTVAGLDTMRWAAIGWLAVVFLCALVVAWPLLVRALPGFRRHRR